MTSIQERLQLKRIAVDEWNVRIKAHFFLFEIFWEFN